jgi:hypothetical protein
MSNLFKDEFLNEELKKGNITPRLIGHLYLMPPLDQNKKTWKSKVCRKLKENGFVYHSFYDTYFSHKISYNWSAKKWDDFKFKILDNYATTNMQQMQPA